MHGTKRIDLIYLLSLALPLLRLWERGETKQDSKNKNGHGFALFVKYLGGGKEGEVRGRHDLPY